jgi:hypothetical protein
MNQLKQAVTKATELEVRFGFTRRGQLYEKTGKVKYNFMDYVIKHEED